MAENPSLIHQSTQVQLDEYNGGRYYNVLHELETFMNVYKPLTEESDIFHTLNDPTISGFKVFFHFDSKVGLLADESNTNSALAYLKRINQMDRYNWLKVFINQLSRISMEAQWLFQEIEGMNDIMKRPFSDVNKSGTLNIKTLETIDYKVNRVMMLYREIAFDQNRGVWVLPLNLRSFSMSVYIYDIRMFDSTSKTAVNHLRTRFNNDIKQVNHVLIDCGSCTFNNNSTESFYKGSIGNIMTDYSDNNISIDFLQTHISGLFKQLSNSEVVENIRAITENSSNETTKEEKNKWKMMLKEKIMEKDLYRNVTDQYNYLKDKNSWKKELDKLGENAMTYAVDKVHNALSGLFLGNVYEFGLSDVVSFGSDGSMLSTATKLKLYESNTQSLKPREPLKDFGNVYE